MSVIGNNILMGASGQGGGYVIDNSLRFRASASAYLSRTPASAGNRKTWTWSGWVKRGTLNSTQTIFHCSPSSGATDTNYGEIQFASDSLVFSGSATTWRKTTQVFRDVSAWYHVVVVLDTTQATAADRVKIYINGVIVSSFSINNNPTQNTDLGINQNVKHALGARNYASPDRYTDGYLTEVNFIDGQALDPSSFGEYNEDTGVWQPVAYAGTYGTNGFYLNFSDNTTTTTLGEDGSGNGNDWTANNISLTSGATYDSMTDVPTLTGEDAGNYCVWNPIQKSPNTVVSDGNLKAVNSTGGYQSVVGSIGVTSGKWYWENTDVNSAVGIALLTINLSSTNEYIPLSGGAWVYSANGTKVAAGINTGYGVAYGTSDVIGVALDLDAGTVTFYKNGTSQGVAFSGLAAGTYAPYAILLNIQPNAIANFGQRPFAYTPPSGFKSLNTFNLPDSDIVNGSEHFDALLYTGDQTTGRAITGLEFQPDFVWAKARNNAQNHTLYNSVVGATKYLNSNTTTAESTNAETLQSFDSNGFTLGNAFTNESGYTYVAWNWKANGAGVSNTDGSITSTVSANPTSGFSIVTWTAGSTSATIGHGLGVAPAMFIYKNRTTGGAGWNWLVYHKSIGATSTLRLNLTDAASASSGAFNNTAPTSSVFSIGTGITNNGDAMVAYCFSEVEGYSKFGSYTGNGSADGPFVYLGFRPAFVLIKRSSNVSSWFIYDTARDTYNVTGLYLCPDLSQAESGPSVVDIDVLSNGFKLRTSETAVNGNTQTFIYMAFAETDFANSLAR